MEAYPGDPYAYAPMGGGRKFQSIEGVLPLLLLIVIAFFVLQFLGVLPCIIPIGCGGEAKVLVIGTPSSGVETVLTNKEARLGGIEYRMNYPQDAVTGNVLKHYNLIVLQGDAYFDSVAREALKSYVDMGGNLIVIEDAGSKHPDYPNVASWEWPIGNGIPVPAKIWGEELGYTDVAYGAEILFPDPDHPMVKGLADLSSQLNSLSRVVKVSSDGDEIVVIRTNEGMWPAVIEGGSGMGKVIYFAYDPGQTGEIFFSAIKYLTGATGE